MISFYTKLMLALTAPREEEKGATAVEYGLMVALIAAAIITVVGLLGDELVTLFNEVTAGIQGR